MKHPITKAIPNVAKMSNTTTNSVSNVWVTFKIVPSKGTPSANEHEILQSLNTKSHY